MRSRSRWLDGTGLTSLLLQQSLRSLVRSVQYAAVSVASGDTSDTATITSVDTANTLLFYLGASSAATTDPRVGTFQVELTNATTVTATRAVSGANATARVVVIECWPGLIRRVQRSSVTISGGNATGTATITAVNTTKTFVNVLGSRPPGGTYAAENQTFDVTLTNSTTLTATRVGTTSALQIGFQAVELY